ncbi:MAG: CRISPR-associated endonuclease Cas1 [Candidatus Viridilinea halotolerans]|uniref:CRISPR-associated endonuclease Cas1 n=1 Tax=Candidatus Viridilinea halotolerans TaxID=2491704 RepID=A0A426TWQ8_9CHLR|nr:MAG: CRISPR-associated endonuclease Cas1 [Candidatus Viridilinea halotolerans]
MTTLYLVEQGATISLDGERITISREEEELRALPLAKISDVIVFGNCSLTTPALRRLLDRGVELTFLTTRGRYQGRLVGMATPHVQLRRNQYRRADDEAWALYQLPLNRPHA